MMLCIKKFLNQSRGHIIIRDLNVIESLKLRELMHFGTKYRIPFKYSVNDIITHPYLDLDLFTHKKGVEKI